MVEEISHFFVWYFASSLCLTSAQSSSHTQNSDMLILDVWTQTDFIEDNIHISSQVMAGISTYNKIAGICQTPSQYNRAVFLMKRDFDFS